MHRSRSGSTLALAGLAGLLGCGAEPRLPTNLPSTPPSTTPPVAPTPPPPVPPTISGPTVVYMRASPLTWVPGGGHDFYVLGLGSDGAFALLDRQGSTHWATSGRYSRADSVLTFAFNGWSVMGPWLARGTLHGDSLIIEYGEIMVLTDFEGGVYVRVPSTP